MGISMWVLYFFAIYFAVFTLLVMLDKGISEEKLKLKKLRKVTIGIPAWNEEASIVKTLEHVTKLDYPKELMQIIVVNDGSKDNTAKFATEFIEKHKDFDIKLINQENAGKGAALNRAIKEAKHEVFICLDADSYVEENALRKMLPYLEEENVAVVLPFIKIPKRNSIILKIQWIEYLLNFFLKKISGSIDCIQVTPGPFAVYKKDALIKVGLFDTKTLTEDQEIAMRLQKYNYKLVQLLDVNVLTEPPTTLKGWHNQRNRWYKGTIFNLIKHKSWIFNPKYGEFGIWQMPMIIASALLTLTFGYFVLFKSIAKPILQKLYDLSYIDFNVGLMVEKSFERFNWVDMNFMLIFFTFVVFLFTLTWIIGAHKFSNESFFKKGLVATPLYMIVYPYLLFFVWASVFFDLARRKVQKW